MPLSNPYPPNTVHTIPARSGVAVPVSTSQTLRVINTHGTQVIDFWAFATSSPDLPVSHHLSMSHTRGATLHLSPLVDDILTTNHRLPILRFVADTTPGVHDTLIPACDLTRYRQLTHNEANPEYYHPSCSENLRKALARDASLTAPDGWSAPDPLNLFMNIPVVTRKGITAGAGLQFEETVSEAGQSVTFEALMDCMVVMSACPQDLVKVNAMEPRDAAFVVEDAKGGS